ncbi:hypothetical protein F9L33_11905 [Amylibacter sp. SFDW26]|uniref:hypothetical protein n=1 Tax=Amylibacter sp. SFDW26 TaxID=2652722 RepID=UPI00126185AE|nr:hypothetical protein [Amylibacter sp. SFDW26]KAB7613303.1 hypothetical protein F9L33_11905 [Amylibacter sp. SFDW26]
MNTPFQAKIKTIHQRLIHNMDLMDSYAKFEVTARDTIPEALLYGDSMKALDRAVKRLNEQHKAKLQ